MKEKGFASILFIMITAALAITGCVKNAAVTPSDKEEPVRIENSGIPAAIKEERMSEETAELTVTFTKAPPPIHLPLLPAAPPHTMTGFQSSAKS